MPTHPHQILTFNRGEIDPTAEYRLDVDRLKSSASIMDNFVPERLGTMSVRPPFQSVVDSTAALRIDRLIPFTFNATDNVLLAHYGAVNWAIIDNDELLNFADVRETSYESVELENTPNTVAFDSQDTVVGEEHSIVLTIRDDVSRVRIGYPNSRITTPVDILNQSFRLGHHVLTFTPTAPFRITVENLNRFSTFRRPVTVRPAPSGVLTLESLLVDRRIVELGSNNVGENLRYYQTGNIMFFCGSGVRPFVVRRRGRRSWSLEAFVTDFEPFGAINTTDTTLRMAQDNTLIANRPFFTDDDVDKQYRLTIDGQSIYEVNIIEDNYSTGSILISGSGVNRRFLFGVQILHNGEGDLQLVDVNLQRSVDNAIWNTVATVTYSSNGVATIDASFDDLDEVRFISSIDGSATLEEDTLSGNIINLGRVQDVGRTIYVFGSPPSRDLVPATGVIYEYDDKLEATELYYRLQFDISDTNTDTVYTAVHGFETSSGSSTIGVRVDSVIDQVTARVDTLTSGTVTAPTRDWQESDWNSRDGYPTAVTLYQGRLWWALRNRIWASVSDAYNAYDLTIEGGSSAIQRSIGYGAVDDITWIDSTDKLMIGGQTNEIHIRSDNFGEIITNVNINLVALSHQGSAAVQNIKNDNVFYFVQRSQDKIFEASFNVDNGSYSINDITLLNPNILRNEGGGVKRIVILRQPETRIVVLLNDGTLRVYLTHIAEDVNAWSRITTDGFIDDIAALPSTTEDRLYAVIRRGHNILSNVERLGLFTDTYDELVDNGDFKYTARYKTSKLDVPISERSRITAATMVMTHPAQEVFMGDSEDNVYRVDDFDFNVNHPTSELYDVTKHVFDGYSQTNPRIFIRADNYCRISALTYTLLNHSDTIGQRNANQ